MIFKALLHILNNIINYTLIIEVDRGLDLTPKSINLYSCPLLKVVHLSLKVLSHSKLRRNMNVLLSFCKSSSWLWNPLWNRNAEHVRVLKRQLIAHAIAVLLKKRGVIAQPVVLLDPLITHIVSLIIAILSLCRVLYRDIILKSQTCNSHQDNPIILARKTHQIMWYYSNHLLVLPNKKRRHWQGCNLKNTINLKALKIYGII